MSGPIHPDAVHSAILTLELHGGQAGPNPILTMSRVLVAYEAWKERHEAQERAHAARRDDPMRLAETRTILDIAEARTRAREYECKKCLDKLTPEGTERD